MPHVETLIVGGGLAGLSLAYLLHQAEKPFTLIEARERLGGRIKGFEANGQSFDLGPAWFWPGQPRIAKLIAEFNLKTFEQFSKGAAVYEDEQGRRQTAHGFASMAGSFRLDGGFVKLVNVLRQQLPSEQIRLSHPLEKLWYQDKIFTAVTPNATYTADRVVLAVPPRVAGQMIEFEPPLPKNATTEIPTWMAGHAKAVAIYDTAFWRRDDLSGDGASRVGPLMEIHDASPNDGSIGALFGFIGVSVDQRKDADDMHQAILDQLGRMFGAKARSPKELVLADWAFEPFTATHLDHPPLYAHPKYGMPRALDGLCDGRLVFGSTETAPEFGGYLEGALEAAEVAFAALGGSV